jgi:5-methylcytosine-specific restriction endonuclease McrBC regulatory subunit McrC
MTSRVSGQVSEQFEIVESREKTLALTDEQVDALRLLGRQLRGQAEFYRSPNDEDGETVEDSNDPDEQLDRSVIRCTSDGHGKYKVRVANAIGAVALPGATLHVLPKIPVEHFAHIARQSYSSFRSSSEAVSVDSLDVFWEIVAQWCVESVEHLVRYGLLSDYKEYTDDLAMVRGRVNIRGTTNNFLRGRLKAECTFDELDIDHPLNRILRAAVRTIASRPSITNSELKKRASRLDHVMDGIGPLQQSDLSVQLDRRTHRYADAVDLCCRVLGVVGTNVAAGAQFGRTFLIPTPGLIEDGVRTILRRALSPVSVSKQGKVMDGDVYFSVNPDLVFSNGLVTGDVKYKVASAAWNRGDVQQASMFAAGFSTKAAVITTFSCAEAIGDLVMQLGELELRRIVWDARDDVSPGDAEESFVARVGAFLAGKIPLVAVA